MGVEKSRQRPQAADFLIIDLVRDQFELMPHSLFEDGYGVHCGVEKGVRLEDEDEQAVQDMLEHDWLSCLFEDRFYRVDDDTLVFLVWHSSGYN